MFKKELKIKNSEIVTRQIKHTFSISIVSLPYIKLSIFFNFRLSLSKYQLGLLDSESQKHPEHRLIGRKYPLSIRLKIFFLSWFSLPFFISNKIEKSN